MAMLLAETRVPYKHLIKKELGENPSGDDVLTHLFGDHDGYINSRYEVVEYVPVKTNAIQRINVLWFIPMYAIFVAPIRWVLTGRTGMKTNSKAYQVSSWLIGRI